MTARQISTLIAALRHWQVRNHPQLATDNAKAHEQIARQAGPALDDEEIETLIEIVASGPQEAERVRIK